MQVTREQLFEEVWQEPMLEVAKRYGVSGSYMARVCTVLNVPRPEVGYWAKKAVGRAPAKPALPEPAPGTQVRWTPGEALYGLPAPTARRNSRRRREPVVGNSLLAGANALLENAKEVEGYLRPTKRCLVDVLTSKAALNHTIETAEVLFTELETRGHRLAFAPKGAHLSRPETDEREEPSNLARYPSPWRPDRATVVHVGSIVFGLSLMEISEKTEVAYVRGDYIPVAKLSARVVASTWKTNKDLPSGRLRLVAYSPYRRTNWKHQWDEETPGDLRVLAGQIAGNLEKAVNLVTKQIEEGDRQAEIERQRWEEQRRKWDEEERIRQRIEANERSVQELSSIFGEWQRQHRLDAFFLDVLQRASQLGPNDRASLEEKVSRARKLLATSDCFERLRSWEPPES